MKCYPQKVERAKEERREAGRDGHEFPHSTCQHPRPPHGATATGALPAHSLSSVDSACCYPGSDSPQPRLPEGVREAPSKKEDPFPPPDTTEVSKVKILGERLPPLALRRRENREGSHLSLQTRRPPCKGPSPQRRRRGSRDDRRWRSVRLGSHGPGRKPLVQPAPAIPMSDY